MPFRLSEENRDDILVTIKATDVDEAPGIADGAADPGLAELDGRRGRQQRQELLRRTRQHGGR